MKKIIEGKLYDTKTAECLHAWDNGRYGNDFRCRSKSLYRTKKGVLFMLHEGGAMTDMAVACGSNSTSGSSDIEPIFKEDAIRFLETHAGADVILKHFPEAVEEA